MASPYSVEDLCCALRSIRASFLEISAENAAQLFGEAERAFRSFLAKCDIYANGDTEKTNLLVQSAMHGLAAALADFWQDVGDISKGLMPAGSGSLCAGDRDGHAEAVAHAGHCLYLSSVVCFLLNEVTIPVLDLISQLDELEEPDGHLSTLSDAPAGTSAGR